MQVEKKKSIDRLEKYTDNQLQVLSSIAYKTFKYEIDATRCHDVLQLVDFATRNKDGKKHGTVAWTHREVELLLANLGLPLGSPLSVLVVQTLPQITNIFENVSRLDSPLVASASQSLVAPAARQAWCMARHAPWRCRPQISGPPAR